MNAILSQAADLLEQPNVWTQQVIARDKNGGRVANPNHQQACQWCTLGAIEKVAGGYSTGASAARIALRKHLGMISIAPWNDDPARTQAEVVAALREAASK